VAEIWHFRGSVTGYAAWLHRRGGTGPLECDRGRICAGSRRIASIPEPLLSAIQIPRWAGSISS